MLIIVKSILAKTVISLVVGAASSFGMKAGVAIWDKTIGNRLNDDRQTSNLFKEAEPT